jgi:hypothetical protein
MKQMSRSQGSSISYSSIIQIYRGKNSQKLHVLVIIKKWNRKLEEGWARVLLVSSCTISPKGQKHLSEYEIKVVGYIGAILSASHIPTWAEEVAFAFGTVGNAV